MNFFANLSKKRAFTKFANKSGFLSFGFVDQNSDEHKIVRGLTVSDTHRDDSYLVGSVGSYNITVVDRSDKVKLSDGKTDSMNWQILAVELHTDYRIPHFLLSANNHDIRSYSALFTSFPNMNEVTLGVFESYNQDFISRFTIFARPAKSAEVQQFLNSEVTRTIGAHFWPLTVEQHDNVLYVYSTKQTVSIGLLNTMLENGIWLAGQLDARSQQPIV